VAEMNKHK
jgi:hypothetical protein